MNVVGVTHPHGLLDTSVARWRQMLEINLTSQFLCGGDFCFSSMTRMICSGSLELMFWSLR